MHDDTTEQLRRAIMLLDCALPHFHRQAEAEKRHNASGGGLRQITCQERLTAVRDMIENVGPTVGYHG